MKFFISLIILVNITTNFASVEINNKQIVYRIPSWFERYEKFFKKIQTEIQGLDLNQTCENDEGFNINISLTLNITVSDDEELQQNKLIFSKQTKDITIL